MMIVTIFLKSYFLNPVNGKYNIKKKKHGMAVYW